MRLSNQEIFFSIIIPVFNVDRYLERCIDSILNQKFTCPIEIIAVDDASTDNSLQILYGYKLKYPSIKIIEHKINLNLSCARSSGIKAAIGKYIMHVDSDDWLMPNAIENLYYKCIETEADVLVFNYSRENGKDKKTFIKSINQQLITTNKLLVQKQFFGTSWNKIVRRSLTENMIYGEVSINTAEDLLYATEILLKANTICLIPDYYYVYFANSDSLTAKIKPDQLIQRLVPILGEIFKITNKYLAPKLFKKAILLYIDNYIYMSISQSAFLYNNRKYNKNELLEAYKLFSEITNVNRLNLALNNKYYSLLEVLIRFGPIQFLGMILRAFKKPCSKKINDN